MMVISTAMNSAMLSTLSVRYLSLLRAVSGLKVKCSNDESVQNNESLCGHCTNERRVRSWDKKVRRDVI